jgi:hypothetical protein
VLYHPLPTEGNAWPEWLGAVPAAGNLTCIFNDKSFDHTWLREQVEKFAAFLLGSYDTVTFAEVDEIIALDPGKVQDTSLLLWLDGWAKRQQPAARCTGYEVVHRFGEEPNLDIDGVLHGGEPLLAHRRWWCPSVLYSKTLTWRLPPHWNRGFHDGFTVGPTGDYHRLDLPREPELLLLHLHKVDYLVGVARWRNTRDRDWNRADLKDPQAGIQNRFAGEDQLREWWYINVDDWKLGAAPLVRMPDRIRGII